MHEGPKCALCQLKSRACRRENGSSPAFCATKLKKEIMNKVINEYKKQDIREFALQASIQEAEGYTNRDSDPFCPYPVKSRLQEIIEFSKKMRYKKLGLPFCFGVRQEASILNEILEKQGFQVVSVICKVGGIKKELLGIKEKEKIHIGSYETMCNPIGQAEVLNSEGTDFNIIFGLCVGHDSLFMRYSQAMSTVLAVKDRVFAHNPMGAIYTANSYYCRFLVEQMDNS